MARRHLVQPAQNDPNWGVALPSASARATTDNVEPLRTRDGECYPGIEADLVKAWYFRRLRRQGAPACSAAASAAMQGAIGSS